MEYEGCGYSQELEELSQRVADLKSQYESIMSDLSSVLAAESELISCLRLHVGGYFENLGAPRPPEKPDLEVPINTSGQLSCQEALRALLALRSRESSLTFMLAELRGFIINEIIRLAGLVGLCRHFEPELAEGVYSGVLDSSLRRYLAL